MTRKRDDELTLKQEAALLALLSHSTLKAAAEAVGIAEKTLWRWMHLSHFVARLRTAQRAVFDRAIGELQAATVEAVATLRRNLACGNPFAENTAAVSLLSQAHKATEQHELQQRIETLESLLKEQGKAKVKRWA